MFYSESLSEPDFNFAIYSASKFAPAFSESKSKSDESESDFSSVFMNLEICIFIFYIYTLLNKIADDFYIYFQNKINSYASNAGIMHIFFRHITTQKVCLYHTIKFSYSSF